MPTWAGLRIAGLRFNWLRLWVCISLDPSSGSSPFWLMMRFVFVWTEVKGRKMWGTDSQGHKEKVKAKGFKTVVSSQSANSWINMLFPVKNDLEHVESVISQEVTFSKFYSITGMSLRVCESYITQSVCVVCIPGMWPGTYRRCILRWQRPGSEVQL